MNLIVATFVLTAFMAMLIFIISMLESHWPKLKGALLGLEASRQIPGDWASRRLTRA